MYNEIMIRGARENNLQDIDINIPKNKLVVLTGLSGSGKSSLAYDTLQKECQRQYMESMGMGTDFISKPKVESIVGLSPSISVDQHITNRSPRSTVGTATEIFTYLRVLFAKLGVRGCPKCGNRVQPPFAAEEAGGLAFNEEMDEEGFQCPHCEGIVPVLSMSHFSFNKPQGACETCMGLGTVHEAHWDSLIDDTKSINEGAVREWDIHYIKRNRETLSACGKHYGFTFDVAKPVGLLNDMEKDLLFYGVNHEKFSRYFPGIEAPETASKGRFEGIGTNILRRYSEKADNAGYQRKMEKFLIKRQCPNCNGGRLKEYSRKVTVEGKGIIELSEMPLIKLFQWIKTVGSSLSEQAKVIAAPIVNDLEERIGRILQGGIGYLSLSRGMTTLSGGEAQRLRLASLLGSGLTGVLYVLDEPTTGLHARDTQKLLGMLQKLKNMGNTVLVIEHDTDMMLQADYIIDMGPGAGKNGGRMIACGTPEEIMQNPDSVTGKSLKRLHEEEEVRGKRRNSKGCIVIQGAAAHNLKNIDVSVPLGKLVAVSGVSGSGKSTLVFDILDKAVSKTLYGSKVEPGKHTSVSGFEDIDRIVTVDQTPIGRNPGSNAATYTEVFTPIRSLFAKLSDSKINGFAARDFSFNVPGGRCDRCGGAGVLNVEMHFLPNAEITCPVCKGKRFKKHILSVKYCGKSISDILDMSIEEAHALFEDKRDIASRLQVLIDVGLGYLKLGQPATTLSGGEAQRVKLAKELGRNGKGHTLYLLDEPTTGLHSEDVRKLVNLLHKLVDTGNTVCVVEHNLDLIRESDWMIDMGPEGGEGGGRVIAQGTPEEIMKKGESYTAESLAERHAFPDIRK